MPYRVIDGAEFGPFRSELLLGAVVLALCSDQHYQVRDFRKQRSLPGLTQPEVEKLQILAGECDARLENVKLGSTDFEIEGRSGYLRNWVRWVHYPHVHGPRTAYYLTLLASQSVNPATLMLTASSVLPGAQSAEYFEFVMLPLLAKMGLQATLKSPMLGRFPNVGLTSAHITPSSLGGLELVNKGEFERLEVMVTCNGSRPQRYRRFLEAVCEELHPREVCVTHRLKEGSEGHLNATLVAKYSLLSAGFSSVQCGEKSPQQLAIDLVQSFKGWASSNQVLDPAAPHYLLPALYLSAAESRVQLPHGDWEPYVRLYNQIYQRKADLSEENLISLPAIAQAKVAA
jgi:RNA 3'-terminal phosphate cyclase